MQNRNVSKILQRKIRNCQRLISTRCNKDAPVDVSDGDQSVELTTVSVHVVMGAVQSTASGLCQSRGTSDPDDPSDEEAIHEKE